MIGMKYHIDVDFTAGYCAFAQPAFAPLCRGVFA